MLWQIKRDAPLPAWREPRNCADARYLSVLWAKRALVSKALARKHLERMAARTLHDFEVRDGNHAWTRAVREVQRAYPGTEAWLLSCSSSEGGHGRWVRYGGGDYYPGYSGVGGWLQFMPGTWSGFFSHAAADVKGRGFIVPDTADSWQSALGQALAGAWGITHGMRHHWAGGGCWQ